MEYIVLVRLSPQQIPYYASFTKLSNDSAEEGTMNAVVAYATCAKIWNHPDLLYHAATRGNIPEIRLYLARKFIKAKSQEKF